jgi:hypothetical protein
MEKRGEEATDYEGGPFGCRGLGDVSLYANQFVENFLGGTKLSPYLCGVKTIQRLTKK